MRHLRRRVLLPILLFCLAAFGLPGHTAPTADQPQSLTLTLLHDNDLHGHLFPFAYTEVGRSPNEQASVGGAARRATLIRQLKRQIKNPVMLIDSGDTFTRGPLTNAYEGIADTEAMNAVGYELAAVGNNEFKAKDGVDQNDALGAQAALLRVVRRSRFPWICANVRDEHGALLQGVEPFVVREFNGVRVGFLGLTTDRSGTYPQTKGWTFQDPVAAAKEWIPKARAECDMLIAVTHIGVDDDKRLAAQTVGLDAIVGGDSHTFLYQAVPVVNPNGITVPIVQDGEFGVNLGRFDLNFARDAQGQWHLVSSHDVLLPVGPKLAEAKDVVTALAPFVRPFQKVVGHLDRIAPTPETRTRQTTQVIVDALRRQTGADLALNPAGGGLFGVFHRTTVTQYDVYQVMSFHNNVVTARLTGAEIRALLAANPTTVVSGDTSSLADDQTYTVAFVDFIARTVYKLPEAQITDTGRDMRDVVIAYLNAPK